MCVCVCVCVCVCIVHVHRDSSTHQPVMGCTAK